MEFGSLVEVVAADVVVDVVVEVDSVAMFFGDLVLHGLPVQSLLAPSAECSMRHS
ncbi:MAG: hypothetical protein MK135_13185 [Polyangiaceae bacterium]|nr:hypothetical protein [Polyangiaceae bacterium]